MIWVWGVYFILCYAKYAIGCKCPKPGPLINSIFQKGMWLYGKRYVWGTDLESYSFCGEHRGLQDKKPKSENCLVAKNNRFKHNKSGMPSDRNIGKIFYSW